MRTEGLTHRWIANLSILLLIVFFCFLSVGVANAGSYTYTLSGGPSSETPLVVDDDLEVKVNEKTVFIDGDNVSTHDGRATWKGAPITFYASPSDTLRIIATDPGGIDIELSQLYLHVNGQSLKLSDGVPKTPSEVYAFFNESFIISIPPPLVSVLDYSPSPAHGEEDLNVKISWSNIPAGWKLVVSLEESEWNITRLADDVSKMVSGSGEETFKLNVYPTTETHGEAKVCACFNNEKGEWTGVFDKKNIIIIPIPEIVITNPEEGEEITRSLEGYPAKGIYSGLENGFNIYLIIHPITTGQWWVQSTPTVFSDGTWEAKVFFGTKDVGAGEDYGLYAIITEEMLNEGLIGELPAYVAKSEVKVSRVESPPLISREYLYVGVIALVLILLPLIAHRKGKKRSKPPEEIGKKEQKEVKFPENEIKQHEATISEPEDMEGILKGTYPEKDAARLASAFRIAQDIRNNYCDTNTKAKNINKEFELLKMYLTGKEFLDEVKGIQGKIKAELREDERLDGKHVEVVKDFCEKFTEMWIAKFLR